jgi:hypothetical protein
MSDFQRLMRRFFAISNDINAISRTAKTGNPRYVTNRVGRRISYRLSNRLIRQLFPPIRSKGRHRS